MLCLELCFNFTVFSFKNTLYQQVFGAPMRSCISPVVANIFMAYLEKTAINTFHTPPTLWVCFVDNTFCVIKRSCVIEFHDHLDGISSFIKFTCELEVDGRLLFLDVLVTRQHSGTLTTTIYHKSTHTNCYLQFTSHHPRHHKLSVAHSLHSRLNTQSQTIQITVCNLHMLNKLNIFAASGKLPIGPFLHVPLNPLPRYHIFKVCLIKYNVF